jgi:hypothetical protein
MIKRFDVPNSIANQIEEFLLVGETLGRIPWYCCQNTVSKEQQERYKKQFKFSSKIADYDIVEKYFFNISAFSYNEKQSKAEVCAYPILDQIKPLQDYIALSVFNSPIKLMRLYINMFLHTNIKNAIAHPHIDSNFENSVSCIYYVNDSTGDTVIFDDDLNVMEKITPKKGTGVIFNSNLLHAGCYPNDENTPRVIINFLFKNI